MPQQSVDFHLFSRPLEFILNTPEEDILRQSVRDGRCETRDRFPDDTPNFHKGLHAYVNVCDYLKNRLAPLNWQCYSMLNQMQYLAPLSFSTDQVRVVYLTGRLDEENKDGFRINKRTRRSCTRFLLDLQGQLVDDGQLSLFEEPDNPPTYYQIVFLLSSVVSKMQEDGSERDYLQTFLAYPAQLTKNGTILECEDYEMIDDIDFATYVRPQVLPQAVENTPELFDLEEGTTGASG